MYITEKHCERDEAPLRDTQAWDVLDMSSMSSTFLGGSRPMYKNV